MSVYIETSGGDIVVDLYTDECPLACKNFLKLCKIKYYHNCLFFKVSRNFIAQAGDPSNEGKGGSSIYGLLDGPQSRCFKDEILPDLKHVQAGMLGMATGSKDANASQFYVTLAPNLDSLDGKHTLFAEVAEDKDGVIGKLNAAIVDGDERPLQNIRIRRTEVLDDPFEDPPGLEELVPETSPEPRFGEGDALEEDWVPEEDTRDEAEKEADLAAATAENQRVLLEMIGDRPFAEAKAEENFIFVCKLNPVTEEEDLETIFSRFGTIISCDIIRDRKTGDSLNYAFIGFETKEAAEEAYLKMNNALVDDRRIKVDFSQSMYHQWKQYKRFGKFNGAPGDDDAGGKGGPGGGGGLLMTGGKFRLKTDAYGHGVGAGLGLVGRGGPGHGNEGGSRRHRNGADDAATAGGRDVGNGAGDGKGPDERHDHRRGEKRGRDHADRGAEENRRGSEQERGGRHDDERHRRRADRTDTPEPDRARGESERRRDDDYGRRDGRSERVHRDRSGLRRDGQGSGAAHRRSDTGRREERPERDDRNSDRNSDRRREGHERGAREGPDELRYRGREPLPESRSRRHDRSPRSDGDDGGRRRSSKADGDRHRDRRDGRDRGRREDYRHMNRGDGDRDRHR